MTIIRTTRFDSARERRAKNVREYHHGLREVNAPPPDAIRIKRTRSVEDIDREVRAVLITLLVGIIVLGAIFAAIVS